VKNVLAIGAHPDDIELGCGGALIKHVNAGDRVTMLVVTKGEVGPGETDGRLDEQRRAAELMGVENVIWGGLPDCEVSLHELDLVHMIEDVINTSGADLIYTHSQHDSHQDHRSVAMATLGAARQHSNILAYASPSYLREFSPNVFIDIADTLEKKIDALACHASQVVASEMVSAERVRNTAGFRGHEARVASAEAYEAIRFVMAI
jgi:LmbE family N-acetylglucosaminyl deacetylase